MAMGGSSNTVLHTLAVATEAGIKLDLRKIDEISRSTPNICKVSPSSNYHMEDVERCGGIPAILKEISKIKGKLYLTQYNNIKDARTAIGQYIHTYNIERRHSALDYQTPAECYYPAMLLPYVA